MASDKGKSKIKKNALLNYFRASLEELRKVTWPTRNRAMRLTFLVLGFCLVVALILGILDFAFGLGYRALLDLGPERTLPASITEDVNTSGTLDAEAFTIGDPADTVDVNLGDETAVTIGGEDIDVVAEPVVTDTAVDVAPPVEPTATE